MPIDQIMIGKQKTKKPAKPAFLLLRRVRITSFLRQELQERLPERPEQLPGLQEQQLPERREQQLPEQQELQEQQLPEQQQELLLAFGHKRSEPEQPAERRAERNESFFFLNETIKKSTYGFNLKLSD